MQSLINTIRGALDCIVYPPSGLPSIAANHVLPNDVRQFYELCGGGTLFEHSAYGLSIVAPRDLVLANPVIIKGVSEEILKADQDDISWSWYVIGVGDNGQFITIDLDPLRLGRCYDSFWDRHPTDSLIIATSFTDLLSRLVESQGRYWYWLESDFQPLGNP